MTARKHRQQWVDTSGASSCPIQTKEALADEDADAAKKAAEDKKKAEAEAKVSCPPRASPTRGSLTVGGDVACNPNPKAAAEKAKKDAVEKARKDKEDAATAARQVIIDTANARKKRSFSEVAADSENSRRSLVKAYWPDFGK